jgi:hypothetical protein
MIKLFEEYRKKEEVTEFIPFELRKKMNPEFKRKKAAKLWYNMKYIHNPHEEEIPEDKKFLKEVKKRILGKYVDFYVFNYGNGVVKKCKGLVKDVEFNAVGALIFDLADKFAGGGVDERKPVKLYSPIFKYAIDPYGEEDWNDDRTNESVESIENIETFNARKFKEYIGWEMNPIIKQDIDDYDRFLKRELIGRKVEFFNSSKKRVTDKLLHVEIKVDYKLFDDWREKMTHGRPIYTNIIFDIRIFLYTMTSSGVYELHVLNNEKNKIKIYRGKQIFSEIDPYGEEEWEIQINQ